MVLPPELKTQLKSTDLEMAYGCLAQHHELWLIPCLVTGTGLRDSDNLWLDGMHGCTPSDKVRTPAFTPRLKLIVCVRRLQTKRTYNQGVIASGLGVLYSATGDTAYLTEAEKTLDAVVAYMTSDGILKEVCDDATKSTCNEDQVDPAISTRYCDRFLIRSPSCSLFSRYG